MNFELVIMYSALIVLKVLCTFVEVCAELFADDEDSSVKKTLVDLTGWR